MTIQSKIEDAIDNPEEMEFLYRNNSGSFQKTYLKVLKDNPDSILLRAWKARLEYTKNQVRKLSYKDLAIMLLICFIAGSLLKIPQWTSVNEADFYPRFSALIPLSAMFIFTMYMREWPRKRLLAGCAFIGICTANILIIPDKWDDVYELACFSLPFLLWTGYGVARLGGKWRSHEDRIEYLRFTGELIIHSGLFMIGGSILLLLTGGVFTMLNLSEAWILEYMAIYGLGSIPLIAAWATDTYSAARKLVPLLAQIFSPLLLTLTVLYMGAMALNTHELLEERSTLLIYNILLLCVLATAVFTLTGRGERESGRLQTSVISLMILSTLILDLIAIYAIGWRISEFGITSNRFAVLGSNIVVFVNLAMMGYGYLRYWLNKGSLSDIEKLLGNFLPVYTVWTFFSVFIQPWIFRY